jgi:hypothetical protein
MKKIMENLLEKLDPRMKKMIVNMDDFQTNSLLLKIKKETEKIEKMKGILKRNKQMKKTKAKLDAGIKKIYDGISPSTETFIFHCLLEATDKLNYIFDNETKLLELTAKREDLKIEEVKENFEVKVKYNPPIFNPELKKEFKISDIRCSNFLNSIVYHNDFIINNANLFMMLRVRKKTIKIDKKETKYYKEDHEFLNDIIKVIALGIVTLENSITKFNKKELTQLRYNFSRMKTFVLKLKKQLNTAEIMIKESGFEELIYESFKLENEIPTPESLKSYLKYLKWIKNNRKLKEEIKMIEKLKNRR